MLVTIMKYVAIAALLMGIFWQPPANLGSYLNFVIAAAAAFVVVQAVSLRRYVWAAVFTAILFVFNPVRPIGFPFAALIALQVTSAALFTVSLAALRTSPRMTIASITEAGPKTESL